MKAGQRGKSHYIFLLLFLVFPFHIVSANQIKGLQHSY